MPLQKGKKRNSVTLEQGLHVLRISIIETKKFCVKFFHLNDSESEKLSGSCDLMVDYSCCRIILATH